MIYRLKSITLGMLCFLFAFPFLFLLLLSLTNHWQFPDLVPVQLGLRNWFALFSVNSDLFAGLLLSLAISLSVAFLATGIGFITSRAVAFHPRNYQLLFAAYFPYILSPVIYAACIYFFFVKFGLAGSVGGVILAQFTIAYPFSVILFSGYWSNRLNSMEQLSATLGGNAFQTFFRVIIPVSRSMLLVCFFQTFLISWFEYGLTTIIGVGKIQTLTVKVFQYIREANPYYAAVASCLLILPPAILLWLNKTYVFKKPA
jgi:putative spermidine/putrescine transport system permease protein